mmetsp:Transcript_97335/g.297362  ORF Transcript_97335/g.297362 Transcript_97335/m.297362 type:complete len:271 (+) Transcript_97335:496-1308(+)
MSSSSRLIMGNLKKDSEKSSTWSHTCARMKLYVLKTNICTLSTASSIIQDSVGMSASHLDRTPSVLLRPSISRGMRSFVSSKLGRTASERSSVSPSTPVVAPFRNTHGFEKVDVSMLSNNSTNCFSCRWHAKSYVWKTRCLIISFCSMSWAWRGYSGENMFADGVPSSDDMKVRMASFCFSKNHRIRSPTYATRRWRGKCASLLSSLTTTSRHVSVLMDTPRAWITSFFLVSTAISENRKKISTSDMRRRNWAPPFTSTSKVASWISFRK